MLVLCWSQLYRKYNLTLCCLKIIHKEDELKETSFDKRIFALIGRDITPFLWFKDRSGGHYEEYRGLLSYFEDMIERVLALFAFIWIIYEGMLLITKGVYIDTEDRFVPLFRALTEERELSPIPIFSFWVRQILNGAFILLVIDAVLQVADLIDSPGVVELTDVFNVSLAAYLVFVLSRQFVVAVVDINKLIINCGLIVGFLLIVRVLNPLIRIISEKIETQSIG